MQSPNGRLQALPSGSKTDQASTEDVPEPLSNPQQQQELKEGEEPEASTAEIGAAQSPPRVAPPTENDHNTDTVKQETPGHEESEEPEEVLHPPRARNRTTTARNATRKQQPKEPKAAPTKRKSARATGAAAQPRGKAKSQQPASPPPPPPSVEIDGDWSNKTRCPCGQSEDNGEFMIACDLCESWQHTACIGFATEKDIPKDYNCPWCKPELYPFLKQPSSRKPPRARSARSSGTGAESTRSVSPPPPPPSLHSASAPEHPARHSRSTAATASNKVSAQTATAHANGHQHQQPGTSKEAMEAHAKSVRRRSTMNSRDAAYEANLAEALRLSKAVAGIRESSPAPDGGAAQPLAHAAATTARPAEEDETSLASATSTTPAAKIEQDLDSALAVAQDEVPKGAVETAPHGHPLHHAAEDAQAQHLQADHQHRPHQHATRSPSEAAATENGKRRRSSEDGYGHPDAGQNKRRRSQSQTPTNEDSVRAAAVAAQAVTPEPGAVGDADGPVEVEVDAMDVDISAPAPTKKPGRGGRRGGGRGSRRGGKAAAATTPAAGGSSQLAENQVEDDQGTFSRHGSNQYAARVKPIPRSKISPHKRPPIHRGGANGHGHSDDPAGMVQTVPDHLSHLAHLVPTELTNGPAPDGPFATEGGHTKIRFPGRRTTMVEMRKRSRAMLEYLQRVQVDTAERDARQSSSTAAAASGSSTPASPSVMMPPPIERKSLGMLDGLQRELNKFQEKFLNLG